MTNSIESGSSQPKPELSQEKLVPKVEGLFNGWRQVLLASDKFKENLAQRYLSGEAHMRDHTLEREGLRVILDDNNENRWIKYSIDGEGDSLMETFEVFVAGQEEVFKQKGRKKLELKRAWRTYTGVRGEGKTYISYEHNLVKGKPEIAETNTQAALDYGQKLLDDFQASLTTK